MSDVRHAPGRRLAAAARLARMRRSGDPASRPSPTGGAARPAIAAAAALGVLLAYAVLRYAVLKGEPLANLPLWMSNKAVAVLAVALLAAAAVRPAAAWRGWVRSAALGAAALHGLASLALLGPAYYRGLFEGGAAGRMNAAGELAILCGVAALVAFAALRLPRRPGPAGPRIAAAGAALVLAHCAALGLPGWLSPRGWPGGLPPMSALLAAVVLGAGIAARIRSRASRATRRPLVPAGAPRPGR
jgi:hypothetical protein